MVAGWLTSWLAGGSHLSTPAAASLFPWRSTAGWRFFRWFHKLVIMRWQRSFPQLIWALHSWHCAKQLPQDCLFIAPLRHKQAHLVWQFNKCTIMFFKNNYLWSQVDLSLLRENKDRRKVKEIKWPVNHHAPCPPALSKHISQHRRVKGQCDRGDLQQTKYSMNCLVDSISHQEVLLETNRSFCLPPKTTFLALSWITQRTKKQLYNESLSRCVGGGVPFLPWAAFAPSIIPQQTGCWGGQYNFLVSAWRWVEEKLEGTYSWKAD